MAAATVVEVAEVAEEAAAASAAAAAVAEEGPAKVPEQHLEHLQVYLVEYLVTLCKSIRL